jgi:UDP-N-acetylmuramoyl-tripeptide--D-alanyl-D-alanine ligase
MELSLAEIQEVIAAEMVQAAPADPTVVRGWSIDSRTIREGELFFAIPGERYDGHAFTAAAFERGAIAAVVSEPIEGAAGPLLKVRDTVQALQILARRARRVWGRPIVAVTGSAGKTSTKDIIASLLSVKFRVGKTAGNFNNHIGLPLSLLRIPSDAEVGVIEIGMNHAGEIRALSAIAEPQIGVVTNVGYAHLEAFSSIDGIAAAKRELIEALPPSGVAVLNADDARVSAFRNTHPGETITFGFSEHADVRAQDAVIHPEGAAFTVAGVRFETSLIGRHAVLNILTGLAVARWFGIEWEALVGPVAALAPGKMRGERTQWRGITILNDAYNSNPEAARYMIDALWKEAGQRRIAVLGEMLELGHLSESLHRDLGAYAASHGVDVLIGVRGVSRFMVDEARKAGLSDHAAFFFEEPEDAGVFLRDFVRAGDAILFKASRGSHLERALDTMEA